MIYDITKLKDGRFKAELYHRLTPTDNTAINSHYVGYGETRDVAIERARDLLIEVSNLIYYERRFNYDN